MSYAELQVTSNFSFLRGASHPQELVEAACLLGLSAVAITDRNTLAGVVRAHTAAKAVGLRYVVGCRLDFHDDAPHDTFSLLCWPTDRAAYGRLCRLLTLGQRRAPKGGCRLGWADLCGHAEGQILAALPPDRPDPAFGERLAALATLAPGRTYLGLQHRYRGDDRRRLAMHAGLAAEAGVPTLATNDVHYHIPTRRPLQDVLTCIRAGCRIDEAGLRLAANAERHLKPPAEMRRLFRGHEDAVERTQAVVERCRFSLDELRYEYPEEPVPPGRTPQAHMEDLTWQGAASRWPEGIPARIAADLRHELALIDRLGYAAYFLTVYDIVRAARDRGILCQGRGSAANSAVCYCLGITAVNPAELDLLFERFISEERHEPPDIDVDFEHERREEVIQYIYARYGRDRAGLAATVISYRSRSAVRDVGKAMGLTEDVTARLAAAWASSDEGLALDQVKEAGLDPTDRRLRQTLVLARQLIGFPRHLSQHVGGFVLTRGRLDETVPIGNAAMVDRTFIEWDKDDIDALGILKVDILALGMLTCIRKAFALLRDHHGRDLSLATLPREDAAAYDMLCRADSIGVFQVESRAQMNMLPRLRPQTFYDLVIEVAIVRPGPIQGDMVHPYLRRRQGAEPVSYPSEDLRRVLGKTLGVPLFQEQAMRIAIVAAGFTPTEADGLRRAMATFRRAGTIHGFRTKFIAGMIERGYAPEFAERCFQQIEGFADYGFPESHSASFALLVYVSAWLKCHYPAAFAAALLNSQPMGFYAPAQIVGDARAHGVDVHPVDVNHSSWDCTLQPGENGQMALRLGLRLVDSLGKEMADRLIAARAAGYPSVGSLNRRAGLTAATIETLAAADAFRSLGLDRRAARWQARAIGEGSPLPLFAVLEEQAAGGGAIAEPTVSLPPSAPSEQVLDDYCALGLSLKAHPMSFLRASLTAERVASAAAAQKAGDGSRLVVAGVVLVRQRPGSAKGVIFITLEDETGVLNLVVWPAVLQQFRRVVMTSRLLLARGRIQRSPEGIVHLVAERLVDRTADLDRLGVRSPRQPAFADTPPFKRHVQALPRHPRNVRVIPKSRDFR